jgi:hypothetical protein
VKLEQGNCRLFLAKLGYVRYRNSRPVLGEVRNVMVNQCGGNWFASIQTEHEVDVPLPTATRAIGVDVGIARFPLIRSSSQACCCSRGRGSILHLRAKSFTYLGIRAVFIYGRQVKMRLTGRETGQCVAAALRCFFG